MTLPALLKTGLLPTIGRLIQEQQVAQRMIAAASAVPRTTGVKLRQQP